MREDVMSPREQLDRRPFLLGLFFPTMSGGWIMSHAAWDTRQHQWRWAYLSQLAQRADTLGLDYLFMGMAYPPYQGFGAGSTTFRAFRMESLSTAAAVASVTQRVFVCPTVHILYHLHPIFLAQMASTIDEVSGGRFGMNIVAGFSPYEAGLLDVPALPHDERYQAADEFLALMQRVWTATEPFDFAGRYYQSTQAWVSPKPCQHPYPLLVNAGISEVGRDFAARTCDWFFMGSPDRHNLTSLQPLCTNLKERAAAYGRRLRPCTSANIICMETDAEAEDRYQWILDNADDKAISGWQAQSQQAVATGLSRHAMFAEGRAQGDQRVFIGGTTMVGSPRRIVEQLVELHQQGVEGVHLVFLDFDEIEVFGARVIPLLREAGLR